MLSKYQLNFWRHFIPICPFNWKTPHSPNNLNLIPSKLLGDCIWYWSYRDWQRAISSLSWYIWCIRENCAGERKLSTRILRLKQLRLSQLFSFIFLLLVYSISVWIILFCFYLEIISFHFLTIFNTLLDYHCSCKVICTTSTIT